jgi:hypothetical protein
MKKEIKEVKVKLYSKVQLEVFPPMTLGKKDVVKDKEGKLLSVKSNWHDARGQKKRSIEFNKNKNVDVYEFQLEWPTVKQLIERELVIKVVATKPDAKQFGTDEAQKKTLMAKSEELGLKPRANATVESLRTKIQEHLAIEKEKESKKE